MVEYVLKGHTQAETATVFNVGTTTIKRWVASYKASGTAGGGYTVANRSAKKIDPGRLDALMNERPDAFLKEIAATFSCCVEAARKALLRGRYTLKKKRDTTRSVTRRRARRLPGR